MATFCSDDHYKFPALWSRIEAQEIDNSHDIFKLN